MTEELAHWMPNTVMAACLLVAIAMLWRMFTKRFDKMESAIETIRERLPVLATVEQLGRLGDRIDGRTTNATERIAVLEALERRKT